MKRAFILGLLGASAALVLCCGRLGCGKSEEKTTAAAPATQAAPGAQKQPWQPKSEEVFEQKKAAQPHAQILQGKLPEGFPSDFPLYPDAKTKSSIMVRDKALVVLSSAAPMADVLALYREQLPSQGWTVDAVNEIHRGAQVSVKAHKGLRNVTVNLGPDKAGGGTEIGVAISSD